MVFIKFCKGNLIALDFLKLMIYMLLTNFINTNETPRSQTFCKCG